MFKVRNKKTGKVFVVYSVNYGYSLYFLIHKDGKWVMADARDYEPAETQPKSCGNCKHENRHPAKDIESPCLTCISGVERGMRLDPTKWEPVEENSE